MRKMRKRILSVLLTAVAATTLLAGCGGKDEGKKAAGEDITVVSREDGSGTRGAFIELFGIEEKDSDGNKIDNTSTENVKNKTYKIVRPFNIVTNEKKLSNQAKDFMKFIMSKEGQEVVADNGYITVDDKASAYKAAGAKGKIVVAGSSSVTPVMEKLKEAYTALNKDVKIEVQQSDSTTGVTSTVDGVCDIGMASRELADSEVKKGVKPTVIAQDGIAVIVNKKNEVSELKSDQIKGIFTGEVISWGDVK